MIREQKNKQAIAAGLTVAPRKVVWETYSAIGAGFKRMGETKKIALKKLFNISHCCKRTTIYQLQGPHQLEKIHRVKLQSGSYENESSCRDFIKAISEFFFQEDILEILLPLNFIAILCDETTDTSMTEQEVVYVFFYNPDTIEPTLTFFEGLGLESGQDVNGILDAIKIVFENFSLSSLLDKVVFLSSDEAYLNSGKKSRQKKLNIAPYFKERLIN